MPSGAYAYASWVTRPSVQQRSKQPAGEKVIPSVMAVVSRSASRLMAPKLWRFRYYRPVSKQRNMISFGSWPEMGPSEARDARSKAKSLLQQDIDPQSHREENSRQSKLRPKILLLLPNAGSTSRGHRLRQLMLKIHGARLSYIYSLTSVKTHH